MISEDDLKRAGLPESDNPPLRLANPMSSEQLYLRTSLRGSVLATLAANQGHGEGPFRLFEVGRAFVPRTDDLPEERDTACGVLAGRRWEASCVVDEGVLDFYDAKGAVETALSQLGIEGVFEAADDPMFHPGRCARVVAGGVELGLVGEVHPATLERFDLDPRPVAMFELRLQNLSQALSGASRQVQSLARYPAATRDLALVVRRMLSQAKSGRPC